MVKALFDTNILVDYLNAVPEARTELQRYTEKAVSIITCMEVGADHDLEAATRSFLSGFDVVAVDEQVRNALLVFVEPIGSNCRCCDLGDSAGACHAARHAKHQGFSG
jgi:predicted nucleic acid-binding protein